MFHFFSTSIWWLLNWLHNGNKEKLLIFFHITVSHCLAITQVQPYSSLAQNNNAIKQFKTAHCSFVLSAFSHWTPQSGNHRGNIYGPLAVFFFFLCFHNQIIYKYILNLKVSSSTKIHRANQKPCPPLLLRGNYLKSLCILPDCFLQTDFMCIYTKISCYILLYNWDHTLHIVL